MRAPLTRRVVTALAPAHPHAFIGLSSNLGDRRRRLRARCRGSARPGAVVVAVSPALRVRRRRRPPGCGRLPRPSSSSWTPGDTPRGLLSSAKCPRATAERVSSGKVGTADLLDADIVTCRWSREQVEEPPGLRRARPRPVGTQRVVVPPGRAWPRPPVTSEPAGSRPLVARSSVWVSCRRTF